MLFALETDREIAEWLAAELAEVETRFAAELLSDLPCVNNLVRYVERYRGKMLRPTLLLLSTLGYRPDQPPGDDCRTLATVVEMVHMATLVHDDILDEAEVLAETGVEPAPVGVGEREEDGIVPGVLAPARWTTGQRATGGERSPRSSPRGSTIRWWPSLRPG